jgi:hypothetical protein
MGKRRSSTPAAAVGAPKKAKKCATAQDFDSPAVSKWNYSKFIEKDLRKAAKDGLLKDDAVEVHMPRPEVTPTPPAGF